MTYSFEDLIKEPTGRPGETLAEEHRRTLTLRAFTKQLQLWPTVWFRVGVQPRCGGPGRDSLLLETCSKIDVLNSQQNSFFLKQFHSYFWDSPLLYFLSFPSPDKLHNVPGLFIRSGGKNSRCAAVHQSSWSCTVLLSASSKPTLVPFKSPPSKSF